ncbi:MAG: slipin family protein [Methanosarcinales archaeon]|jgi:regulator of protease activity HflC (stomatin/prohibitin superfamily)|nr:slipin family protein [Methanosarcinales archaeon]
MIHIVKEYERVVIFRLGRLNGVKGPGLFFTTPFLDKTEKIDMRTVTIDVPKQDIITKDNVTITVDAIVYYKVVDPEMAITEVEDYKYATAMLAQTTLRDVLGQMELDEVLTQREKVNVDLQKLLDRDTDPWGIRVTSVTIRDVSLPDSMLRAIAKQAEAEREKRSRIILAEGEHISATKMRDAAALYDEIPVAIRLRELQTLSEIAREKNMVIVTNTTGAGDVVAMANAAAARKQNKL